MVNTRITVAALLVVLAAASAYVFLHQQDAHRPDASARLEKDRTHAPYLGTQPSDATDAMDEAAAQDPKPDDYAAYSGTVADAISEEALEGAQILSSFKTPNAASPSKPKRGSATTRSDADGTFSYKAPAGVEQRVECVVSGYASEIRELPKDHNPEDPILFRLALGASFSGQVTDVDSGEGVKGILVTGVPSHQNLWDTIWNEEQGSRHQRTGEDGRYHVKGLHVGPHRAVLTARSVGYLFAPEQAVTLDLVKGEERTGVDFLVEKGGVVQGVLRDPKKQPVKGAWVRVKPANPLQSRLKNFESFDADRYGLSAKTRNDGRYEVTGLSFDMPYRIQCSVKGYAILISAPFDIAKSDAPLEIDLTLASGATVSGFALLQDGNPAPGSTIVLQLDAEHAPEVLLTGRTRATADDEGRFVFEHVRKGTYAIYEDRNDAFRGFGTSRSMTIEVDGNTDVEGIEIIVGHDAEPKGSGTISGTVLDPTGQAVPDVRVEARRSDDTSRTTGKKTSDDGTFALKRLKGLAYDLTVACDQGKVEMPRVAIGSTVTLQLRPPTRVSGVVVDGQGMPVSACTVHLERQDRDPDLAEAVFAEVYRQRFNTKSTNSTGRFEFLNVEPGRYTAGARSAAVGTGESPLFDVAEGTEVSDVHIVLNSGIRFAGTVVNGDGQPVAGATVQLRQAEAGSITDLAAYYFFDPGLKRMVGMASSDADGHFEIANVPPSTYCVVTTHPAYAQTLQSGIVMQAGRDITAHRIVMSEGGSASGTLIIDGQPRANRIIQFVGVAGMHLAKTDENGRFTVEGMTPGEYIALPMDINRIMIEGPFELLRQRIKVVDIAEGERTDLQLGSQEGVDVTGVMSLEGLGNVTALSLRRPGGPGADEFDLRDVTTPATLLQAIHMLHYQAGQAFPDEEGRFHFDGIEPGTYILEAFSVDVDLNRYDIDELVGLDLTPIIRREITVGPDGTFLDLLPPETEEAE